MRIYLGLIAITLCALCAVFSVLSDVFLTWANALNILTASSVIGILAIGAAFVIGAGGIDLSVGSVMALSAVAGVIIASHNVGFVTSIPLICLLVGLSVGAINGVLIGKIKLPPFIVTLGMLSFARGLSLIIADGKPVYGLPDALVFMGQGQVLSVPIPVIVFLLLGIAAYIVLNHTSFGRHCVTIGDNEKACYNAGIRVIRHKIILYALSGFLAAISGLIAMGRVNAADPSTGTMYELTAITATIIGGASLSGGRTSVIGAVLGALMMSVLQNGMTLMDMPAYYQQVVIGAMLVLAVSFGLWRGGGHAAAR